MPNKLTIVFSGRKQSGKSSAANYVAAKFLNRSGVGTGFGVTASGDLHFRGTPWRLTENDAKHAGIKIYSFADPLKRFCCDVLGAPEESCYGTDEQKNAPITHLLWENLPEGLRTDRSGPITGRQLMQVFGTDLCRKFYGDCWARGTYNIINREGHTLALVNDSRFPNEIMLGNEAQAKTIRFLRTPFPNDTHPSETALDGFSLDKYSFVLDNSSMTMEEKHELLDAVVNSWLDICF